MAHLQLVVKLWRHRAHDLMIVREFLTALLFVVWPLIWPLRHRTCFVINHNLQEAHSRWLERAMLPFLYRRGARFACFGTPAGFAEVGIVPASDRLLVLPYPIVGLAPPRRPASLGPPVVGVIGSTRAEKGVAEMLECLLRLQEQGSLAARLVLGCPETGMRAIWRDRGVQVLDTSGDAAYAAALELCDVIVLNYRTERYYYRPSKVTADAIAKRCIVVAPDLPLIRDQVTRPVPVGCVFQNLEELGSAMIEALRLRTTDRDPWAAHAHARSPSVLASQIDSFIRRTAGR